MQITETLAPNQFETVTYSGFENQFIEGHCIGGSSSDLVIDSDPFSGEILIEIPAANQQDLDNAYRAAAASQPSWMAKPPAERSTVMRKAARVMELRREEIISWIIHESGSTRIKGSLEWDAVHAGFLAAATMPYGVEGRILPADVPTKNAGYTASR